MSIKQLGQYAQRTVDSIVGSAQTITNLVDETVSTEELYDEFDELLEEWEILTPEHSPMRVKETASVGTSALTSTTPLPILKRVAFKPGEEKLEFQRESSPVFPSRTKKATTAQIQTPLRLTPSRVKTQLTEKSIQGTNL